MTDLQMPRAGEIWMHHGGRRYEIVGLGFSSATGNAEVHYRQPDNRLGHLHPVWTRDLGEFLGWTEDHNIRFQRIGETPETTYLPAEPTPLMAEAGADIVALGSSTGTPEVHVAMAVWRAMRKVWGEMPS